MLDCRGGTRLSMPLRLLREYVRAQILREADPQNLGECRANRTAGNREEISFYPLLAGLYATFLVNHFGDLKVVTGLSYVITALFIFNDFIRFSLATAKRHAARFPRTYVARRAIEIIVAVPILRTLNAATLQPIFLNPVDEVLLIGILSVMDDKRLEASCSL